MSERVVAARAQLDIERPIEVVRAHFLDLDHAIRSRIHHGVVLRWLRPAAPSELRFEETTSVLGRPHADVLVLEERDGAVVRRFVGGPNVGTRVEVSFTPLEGASTRVVATAFTPPEGYRTGIGKLSALGIEKLLQKTLGEHKRALEGYVPGRAQGAVGAVLAPLRDTVAAARSRLGEDKRALMTNLLEAACTVAVADGSANAPERDVIREVARSLCFVELDDAAIDKMVANVAAAITADGIERRCEKIAGRLQALGLGRVGLGVAVLVAEVSHGIGVEERAALECLARDLAVTEAELEDLLRGTDAALAG